jgi:hypothetical protein
MSCERCVTLVEKSLFFEGVIAFFFLNGGEDVGSLHAAKASLTMVGYKFSHGHRILVDDCVF